MSLTPKTKEFQSASAQWTSEEHAQELFNKQKAYFTSDATKSYEWRIGQLDRLTQEDRVAVGPAGAFHDQGDAPGAANPGRTRVIGIGGLAAATYGHSSARVASIAAFSARNRVCGTAGRRWR